MHIDGLRVDAVASMLYLDYGREEGEWIPNHMAEKKISKRSNSSDISIRSSISGFPASSCAPRSHLILGVSHPLEWNGLGFDLKWNLGWMNDTLRYFQRDPLFRHYHQNELTFGLIYVFSERFLGALP